jgi:hypothetical protein
VNTRFVTVLPWLFTETINDRWGFTNLLLRPPQRFLLPSLRTAREGVMNQQEPPVTSLHKAAQSDISDLTISDQLHDTPTNLRSGRHCHRDRGAVTTSGLALRPFFAPVRVAPGWSAEHQTAHRRGGHGRCRRTTVLGWTKTRPLSPSRRALARRIQKDSVRRSHLGTSAGALQSGRLLPKGQRRVSARGFARKESFRAHAVVPTMPLKVLRSAPLRAD